MTAALMPASYSQEIVMKNALSMSGRLRQRLTRALLTLGVVVGALASTATPAHAASEIYTCFVRPNLDPSPMQVRVDLRVWNQVTRVWQYAGWYAWITIQPKVQTCMGVPVPPQYQNFYTTLIVDHSYTLNGTTRAFRGIPALSAPPGGTPFVQTPLPIVTWFTVLSSADPLGVHSAYWH